MTSPHKETIEVVVFTGGRGSAVLSERLLAHPRIRVTLAVNGYDDGASTGEVRRFLGDSLGPSDFRKNASRAALAKRTASPGLVGLLDSRLPVEVTSAEAVAQLRLLAVGRVPDEMAQGLDPRPTAFDLRGIADSISAFLRELETSGRPFVFGDCAVGNVVFAGCYLRAGRRFNDAVDAYAALLGLPAGLIENVTDGTNAHLVALDVDGKVLGTEEAIVDSRRVNRIDDIFLVDRALSPAESEGMTAAAAREFFAAHAVEPALNPRLAERLDHADLIVFAPGTQHSSLFPSYLTKGLTDHIVGNLLALKLLITNLRYDAEIAGASAVTLVERALFYMADKGRRALPGPCLITHYLLNDPQYAEPAAPHVPLGQVGTLEDPRLIRIGHYEDGVSGRHDAAKVIEPFVESLLEHAPVERIAVRLYGTSSPNKIVQSVLEMARGLSSDAAGAHEMHVYLPIASGIDEAFLAKLPFAVSSHASDEAADAAVRAESDRYTYLALFESSGMYRGDELVGLLRYLEGGRVDAAWGSRRLSLRDIQESFQRYDDRGPVMRALSRVGSHLLSAAYLLLYGHYVADTLSGVRIVRMADAVRVPVRLTDPMVNQYVLPQLLRRRADVLEVPVQFLPVSAGRVRRTSVGEGLRQLAIIIGQRFK